MITSKLTKGYSQSNQDLFVLELLDYKKNGTYLEIGGSEPIKINNTYLMETDYEWTGVSVEIDSGLCEKYNKTRKNKCINEDATTLDYKKLLDDNFSTKRIDYLSLDIDPAINTYTALCNLPLDDYRFTVVTFEHELYAEPTGDYYKEKAKEIFLSNGYKLVAENVRNNNKPYEDWYVDTTVLEQDCYEKFISKDLEYSEIISLSGPHSGGC